MIKYIFDVASLQRSDYFTLEGNPTEGFEEKIEKLFELIASALNPHTSFCNLLLWENHIHNAINHALEDGLSYINDKEWDETANWIFTKWGKAYSGKNFESLSEPEKLRSAFHTLNLFLHETIEEEIGLRAKTGEIPTTKIWLRYKIFRNFSLLWALQNLIL